MSDIQKLVQEFANKVSFAVERVNYCADPSYYDGLESYVLGGSEFQELINYARESRATRAEVANAIRDTCARLYEESGIINHALSKPHGYAGDFEILEHIYDFTTHKNTQSDVGRTIDNWALTLSLPRAVRSRKNALYFWLYEFGLKSQDKIELLSIGSGSARELRELPAPILEKFNITLIDRDANSLEFAQKGLLEKVPGLKITAIQESFHRVSPTQNYDIIYSFGVFDYLVDRIVINCMKQYSAVLNEGGRFIYSIKNSAQYQDWFYDFFTDWRFISRSIEDGAQLATESELKILDTCRLESDVAAVYVCAK
jgi:hypothetical protein